jgi:hypothetical protein
VLEMTNTLYLANDIVVQLQFSELAHAIQIVNANNIFVTEL